LRSLLGRRKRWRSFIGPPYLTTSRQGRMGVWDGERERGTGAPKTPDFQLPACEKRGRKSETAGSPFGLSGKERGSSPEESAILKVHIRRSDGRERKKRTSAECSRVLQPDRRRRSRDERLMASRVGTAIRSAIKTAELEEKGKKVYQCERNRNVYRKGKSPRRAKGKERTKKGRILLLKKRASDQ